ncbi:MAG TPA: hypothetical protein VF765_35715 [Polyangiaceae bacterium]
MDKKLLQTQFSMQATDLAESFRSTVGRLRVGPYAYAPDMTSPEGPSTGGGVQALQHLRLVPPQSNMPTLVVGHVNPRDRVAQLRTLEHVDAICRERFKLGAPLDAAQYQTFLQSTQGFLAACGMQVTFETPPTDLLAKGGGAAAAPSMAPPKSNAGLALGFLGGLLMLALLVAGIAWYALKK